ncbi:hypothetical protein ACFLYF_04590 [Chloroflexota bacterium]
MDTARQILSKYDSIFDNLPAKGNLRFGRSTVSISSIASQYYCEKKLELRNEHPLPPTKTMIKGEAGHEAVTTLAVPISKEESIQEAWEPREKPLCIYEFSIGWIHNGVPIIGLVDEAWFRGGTVDIVVERKFSNNLSVYSPYHVQAQLYCLGLGEMGFDNKSTHYRIMVCKRSCIECVKLKDNTCGISNTEKTEFQCNSGGAIAYSYPFNKDKIVKDLDWALDYWTGRREAVPTKNRAKCRVCEYHSQCAQSL